MLKLRATLKALILLVLFAVLVMATTGKTTAHGEKDFEDYEFIAGFVKEPAYEGMLNGVELQVYLHHQDESEAPSPVEGLEKTLQVEVTHLPTGASTIMKLYPVFSKPGHYTAEFIPTAPGRYRFRFFGSIDELAVNETFESGPGGFNDVEAIAGLQFPDELPSAREVTAAARGAQNTAMQARNGVATTTILAVAGLVLGAVGSASGLGAMVMARKQKL